MWNSETYLKSYIFSDESTRAKTRSFGRSPRKDLAHVLDELFLLDPNDVDQLPAHATVSSRRVRRRLPIRLGQHSLLVQASVVRASSRGELGQNLFWLPGKF